MQKWSETNRSTHKSKTITKKSTIKGKKKKRTKDKRGAER